MAKFLSALIWVACCGLVQAEPFFDPMRPPAELRLPQAGAVSHGVGEDGPLVLQSVLISSQRQVAVINGQSVLPGQSIRTYRLLSLNNHKAELQGPQGRLSLWLLPANASSFSLSHASPTEVKRPSQQGDKK